MCFVFNFDCSAYKTLPSREQPTETFATFLLVYFHESFLLLRRYTPASVAMEGELINVYGVTWKWTNFECVYTFLNPLLSCHECMVGNLLPFIWISTNNFQMNEFVNFHLFNLLFAKAPRWWTAGLALSRAGAPGGGSWILDESALCWCHQTFMWPNFPPLFNL